GPTAETMMTSRTRRRNREGSIGAVFPYAAGIRRAWTVHRTAIRPGRTPLPNGSNHDVGFQVRRPHRRGVASPSDIAVRDRTYSRSDIPTRRDASMYTARRNPSAVKLPSASNGLTFLPPAGTNRGSTVAAPPGPRRP